MGSSRGRAPSSDALPSRTVGKSRFFETSRCLLVRIVSLSESHPCSRIGVRSSIDFSDVEGLGDAPELEGSMRARFVPGGAFRPKDRYMEASSSSSSPSSSSLSSSSSASCSSPTSTEHRGASEQDDRGGLVCAQMPDGFFPPLEPRPEPRSDPAEPRSDPAEPLLSATIFWGRNLNLL